MNNVLKFPQKPKPQPKNSLAFDRFFCQSCDGDSFKLKDDGEIYCSSCTTRIRNLRVLRTR